MSKLDANIGEAVVKINRWLGLNESPDGDNNLAKGEAARMRNFRITDGQILQRRPGTLTVAGLLQNYSYETDSDSSEPLYITDDKTSISLAAGISIDSVGNIAPQGESALVKAPEWASYAGWYHMGEKGWYSLEKVSGGNYDRDARDYGIIMQSPVASAPLWAYVFDEPPRMYEDMWETHLGQLMNIAEEGVELEGKYLIASEDGAPAFWTDDSLPEYNSEGEYYRIDEALFSVNSYDGWRLELHMGFYRRSPYTWYFNPVKVKSNDITDTAVNALWSGFVGDKEYIIAACNGFLWSLKEEAGVWEKQAIGPVSTASHVCLFGFGGNLYCLDGQDYLKWDGQRLSSVEGYVPVVASASSPAGGGTLLERVNLLTPRRRQRFSSDGQALGYQLAERELVSIDRVTVDGENVSAWSADPVTGFVTFTEAPAAGSDNVEIWYTAVESGRAKIISMAYAEFYNGATDNRVFLYGDGSNICRYSDIELDSGAPSAEYFPDLNEIAIGDANTPITALIRQYSRLMAFKRGGGAWSIYYSETALPDGAVTAGFYCSGVNRDIGCDGMGQAVLVENKPRTADGASIYEWRAASGGNVTNDQRNAKRISQKVEKTLRSFNLEKAKLFFNKISHEFYCIYGGTAIVQNTENDAWYVYTEFPAEELIVYKAELYYGTADGRLRRVSEDYNSDDGAPIDSLWESGSMDFGMDYVLKYSPEIWLGLKREAKAGIRVGVYTDTGEKPAALVTLADLADVNMPSTVRRRLKVRRFTHYKLFLYMENAIYRATISSVDIRVKYNKNVK